MPRDGFGVALHVDVDQDGLRAQAQRARHRHGGAAAEHARLVRGGGDHAARRRPPTSTGLPRSEGSSRCSTDA